MPTLDNHNPGLRVLIVGEPGSGKSTAIGKLAEAMQKLFIVDFDNNLNPLKIFVSDKYFCNIHYQTLVDPMDFDTNGMPIAKGIPRAWTRYIALAKQWIDIESGEDFGRPDDWPKDHWFVEDSLTTKGRAAMWHTLHKRKRMGKRKGFAEWGDAIDKIEGTLDLWKASNCNFICTAHLARLRMEDVTETADDNGNVIDRPTVAKRLPPNANMRYPVALGQALPPRIGAYFNVVLQAQRIGAGAGARRVLRTVPEEDVDIKVPLLPRTVPPEVSIDKLWDILKHFRSAKDG